MNADIALIDISTSRVIYPKYTSRRQVIVSVDHENQYFLTMTRGENEFLIRKYDQNCEELDKRSIPFFTKFYWGTDHYAMSPDGNRIVYLKDKTRNLYLYDLNEKEEYMIYEDIASLLNYIRMIEWLSNEELLIILTKDPVVKRYDNEIVVFNLINGGKKVLAKPAYILYEFAISPNRQFLAYWERVNKHSTGCIQVLDLKNGQIIATIGEGKKLITEPYWSLDGKRLGYVEGNCIMIFSRDTNSSNCVTMLEDNVIAYDLMFHEDILVYYGGKQNKRTKDYKTQPLMIIDIQTGNIIKQIDLQVNGSMFFLEPGKKVLCEIGQ